MRHIHTSFNITLSILILFVGGISTVWLSNPFHRIENFLGIQRNVSSYGAASLSHYADRVIAQCASSPFPPSCYDEEIPKLMDAISMEQSFEVVKLVQEQDPRYLYCHVVGHKLSFREAEKNPDNWRDVLTRCPTTFCNNGCLHGALLQRFNSESLTDAQIEGLLPDLEDVCEPRGGWQPVRVEQAMCYHALGHLAMFSTNADIKKSLRLCERIGKKSDGRNFVETCTYGVFMQVFQPLEPEDAALVKGLTPTRENLESFCARYRDAGTYAPHGCRVEAWPLFLDEIIRPEGFVQFCSYTKEPLWQKNCYGSMMNIINTNVGVAREDFQALQEFCRAMPASPALPESPQEICFASSAQQLIQLDPRYIERALGMCEAASQVRQRVGDVCYRELSEFARESFHEESQEHKAYCKRLPPQWRRQCLAKKI